MNIGILIAIATISIYIVVGPLVLFGIYVFIDRLAQGSERENTQQSSASRDPALWGRKEVKAYLSKEQAS